MNEKTTRYGVHLRSWQVPGAAVQHHYGRIWRRGPDGQSAENEVRYTLTADDADRLNEKNNDSWAGMTGPTLKRGDLCARYADRARLIDDALAAIAERWGHHGHVECGQEMDCESPLLQHEDGTRGPAAAIQAQAPPRLSNIGGGPATNHEEG